MSGNKNVDIFEQHRIKRCSCSVRHECGLIAATREKGATASITFLQSEQIGRRLNHNSRQPNFPGGYW